MTKALEKVIKSLILPKFPWVVDYEITHIRLYHNMFITIVYYTNVELEFNHKDHRNLMEKTNILYDMVGGVVNRWYNGVVVSPIENKSARYN